jgi:hypothetical protein
LGAGIVVALLAFLAIVIWVPKLSFVQPGGLKTPAERAKAESDLRGHLLQAFGGLVLIVGAVYTARTFALNREGQITERFTRAVEQLANEQLDIRLGGIYALERIAHDSKSHHEPVIEVLTAFLREHAPWPPRDEPTADSPPWPDVDDYTKPETDEPPEIPELSTDVQGAATVLGRRNRRHEPWLYQLNLKRVDLHTASLPGANFSDAFLSEASLRGVSFFGANLVGAQLPKANLAGAYLKETDLERAWLHGADLAAANLVTANLVSVGLGRANLDRAYLTGANLAGSSLIEASLKETYFNGADLTGANLAGANLNEAHFEGADLTSAILWRKEFDKAHVDDDTKLPERMIGTTRSFPQHLAETPR